VPQVVVPGCLDMVNFWAMDTVPPNLRHRKFHEWNPNVTLMRTTPEENTQLGKIFAEKLNRATAPAAVFIPKRGWSELDREGQPFWWPEANQAFVSALKENLRADIPVVQVDCDINDPGFSREVAETLLGMLKAKA